MTRLRWLLPLAALLISPLAAQDLVEEKPETEPESLFRSTLVQDIATSGFYELVTWNDVLGLSTRGNREALKNRLFDFYEVPESARPEEEQASEPPIVVDSASQTSYFTLEETEERYIRLTGGVIVTLRDDDQDTVHRIVADEVTFNQSENTVAASGSVVYVLEREGTTEQFSGEAMTVELDQWEGAFVQGVSERERTIEGEQIDFSFAGTYITRSSDDVIVLDDGRITSSEATPPNYEIRAQKIWVLAPGEWGLENAVLYIGRVPVFYFPFFFRPGNRLFVNPSLGSRDRDGSYIQTTIYLAGEPEEPTSPFSLLQLADEGSGAAATTRDGLYLVPDPSAEDAEPSPDTIKLLADLYTKLGAVVGVEADLQSLGPFSNVSFNAGVAATRHIYLTNYPGAGSAYTPYFIDNEVASQSWNSTQIGTISIPFRYGLSLAGSISGERLTSTLTFDAYSDTRYRQDFGGRAEQIDWLGLIGQGEAVSSPGPITSQLWQIDTTITADTSELERIQSLGLQRGVVSLQWRSRAIDSALLDADVSAADGSPEASFFYPESLRIPEVAGSMSGTLLTLPRRTEKDEATAPDDALTAPWDESDATVDEENNDTPLRLVPPLAQLPAPALPLAANASVSYNLSPTLIVDQIFLDDAWATAEDIDFAIAYGGASARLGSSLSYNASIANQALRLNGSLTGTGQYRDVYLRNDDLPDAEWSSLEQQAWSFTSVAVSNTITTSWFPAGSSSVFSGSNLAYTLNTLLYELEFDEVVDDEPTYASEFIEWDEDFIRQHQVSATAALDAGGRYSLSATGVLPPLDPDISGSVTADLSWVRLTGSTGAGQTDDEWEFDPITGSLGLTFADDYSATSSVSYDVEESELSFVRAGVRLGDATADFEARTTEDATFGGPGVGWEVGTDRALRPVSASAAYALSQEIGPFWRNRVVGSVDANVGWSSSLTRFTEGSFTVGLSTAFAVHEFAALRLSTASSNNQMYVYLPSLAETVGRESRNFFVDLLQSFNFFSRSSREQSGFNLDNVQFSLIHDLGDWDLTVGYSGAPELITADDGTRSYSWQGDLSINVQWRPIGELSTDILIDDEEIRFGADS